jgi:hypothetical protein
MNGSRSRRGTGSIYQRGARWYGRWYVRGERQKRVLGPVRQPGSRDGLTRSQAEARLRALMLEKNTAPPPLPERLTVIDVGERLIRQLVLKGRKSSTTDDYLSYLRVHLEPHFGQMPIEDVAVDDIEDFVEACLSAGLSAKSTVNILGFLNGIFEFAGRKRWARWNPCKEAEKPERPDDDQQIRCLDQAELDALLHAVGSRSPRTPATLGAPHVCARFATSSGSPGRRSRGCSIAHRRLPSTSTGAIRT